MKKLLFVSNLLIVSYTKACFLQIFTSQDNEFSDFSSMLFYFQFILFY